MSKKIKEEYIQIKLCTSALQYSEGGGKFF